jgi:glycosyltransferase involved in cell wall biosynthesis
LIPSTSEAPLLFDVTRLIWRRWAGRHPTGIDRVCLAYLEHYAPRAQAVIQHRRYRQVLDNKSSQILFDLLAKPADGFRRQFIGDAIRYGRKPDKKLSSRLYLNVGHTGLDDPGLATWVRMTGVRPVYFVHDLIPITHPEYCRDGESERHVARMRTALSTGAAIIGNSRATLDQLEMFGKSENLPTLPSTAAWLGNTEMPAPAAIEPSDRVTFVVVGTIEARKNHLFLLQVWTRLAQKMGPQAPRLLIIGRRGWECEQAADLLDRAPALKPVVSEIGGCSDAELVAHLKNARALLFPSLAEGYGLPLVEALDCGTPVIASDLPVFREIGQEIPTLIDPLDGPEWERQIAEYSRPDSGARNDQLARLAMFRTPTWTDHFAKADALLATL